MSDLFNYEEIKENEFNPSEYVRSLCVNAKMSISNRVYIKFLPGWKNIVADFITSIKNYPVELVQISDFYSVLDVEFVMLKNTREVNVWREINNVRQASKSICAQCGNDKEFRRSKTAVSMFCQECQKNLGRLCKTGTWLDKY